MSSKLPSKAKKVAAKKPAAKKIAAKKAPSTAFDAEPKGGMARALYLSVEAFSGDKGALASFLGLKRPNLSRALKAASADIQGTKQMLLQKYTIGLAQLSGMRPSEIYPGLYLDNWKVKRIKPVRIDGAWGPG